MKAKRHSDFNPVILTLETQEEVDALYAVLIHTKIIPAIGVKEQWKCLSPFVTSEHNNLHRALSDILK